MQMNNFFGLIRSINNPQNFVNQMMGNNQILSNPIMKNGIDMFQKEDSKGLAELVNNVAKERGTSLEEIRKQIGM